MQKEMPVSILCLRQTCDECPSFGIHVIFLQYFPRYQIGFREPFVHRLQLIEAHDQQFAILEGLDIFDRRGPIGERENGGDELVLDIDPGRDVLLSFPGEAPYRSFEDEIDMFAGLPFFMQELSFSNIVNADMLNQIGFDIRAYRVKMVEDC